MRSYLDFDPALGYRDGSNFSYECLKCGDFMSSIPKDDLHCRCGNRTFDVDYGRISIEDHAMVKFFSDKNQIGQLKY